MKTTPKRYKLEFTIKIEERSIWRDKEPEIEFTVSEHIPAGIHPVDYLRQRLSEEVRRHASQVTLETKQTITTSGEIAA